MADGGGGQMTEKIISALAKKIGKNPEEIAFLRTPISHVLEQAQKTGAYRLDESLVKRVDDFDLAKAGDNFIRDETAAWVYVHKLLINGHLCVGLTTRELAVEKRKQLTKLYIIFGSALRRSYRGN
jgi:hypothetical protein